MRRSAAALTAIVLVGAVPAGAQATSTADPSGYSATGTVVTYSAIGTVTIYATDSTITSMESETKQADTTTVTLGTDVLFAFGSADLSPRALATIDRVAARIPATGAVSVDGHTDSIGTPAANLALSRRRAQAVAARLGRTRPGVKLTVTGHGESQPVASNGTPSQDDPSGRAKNRRVTIRYAS